MANLTPRHKYHRVIVGVVDRAHDEDMCAPVLVDVYDVLEAYKVTCPALQHLIKKALCVGLRGHKDTEQDLKDILSSAQEAIRLHHARQLTQGEAEDLQAPTPEGVAMCVERLLDYIKQKDDRIAKWDGERWVRSWPDASPDASPERVTTHVFSPSQPEARRPAAEQERPQPEQERPQPEQERPQPEQERPQPEQEDLQPEQEDLQVPMPKGATMCVERLLKGHAHPSRVMFLKQEDGLIFHWSGEQWVRSWPDASPEMVAKDVWGLTRQEARGTIRVRHLPTTRTDTQEDFDE